MTDQPTRSFFPSLWEAIQKDNCIDLAAQTAFYFVLALFPFFIVLAAITSYIPISALGPMVLNGIVRNLPAGSRHLVMQTLAGLTHGRGGFLSFGLATAAWSASSGVVSLMDTLNIAYEVPETRSYWRRRLIALGSLLMLCLFFVVGFGLFAAGAELGEWVARELQPRPYFMLLWRIGRWVVAIGFLVLGVSYVERVLPNVRYPWKWVSVGSLFAVVISIPASICFRIYIQHFTSYSQAYGTLGGFFVLMLWIYLEVLILLLGAELNSELTKRRVRAMVVERQHSTASTKSLSTGQYSTSSDRS